MHTTNEIIKMLSWSNSSEEQKKGIELAQQFRCLEVFFQPIACDYSKDVWANCAIVIAKHSDDELAPYILDMLIWLQDMNWPGAEIIEKRLICYKKTQDLAETLNNLIENCLALEDDVWLANLSRLMANTELINCLKIESYNALSSSRGQEN